MDSNISTRRSSGVLNASNGAYHTQSTVLKSAHLANFEAVDRYVEFINMEFNRLAYQATQDIHDPAMINIETMIAECKLPYKNVIHFVKIITEDGLRGELDDDNTSYVHLTKMGLWNLLQVLLENTEKAFLSRGVIVADDIKRQYQRVILDKTALIQLVLSRGLPAYTGITATHMVNSIINQLSEGAHYEYAQKVGDRATKIPAKVLTSQGIQFIADSINNRVTSVIEPTQMAA